MTGDKKPEMKTTPLAQTMAVNTGDTSKDADKPAAPSRDGSGASSPADGSTSSDSLQAGSGVLVPQQFGRYSIKRTLGEGAMGAVYLAHDGQLNRDVAIKVPKFTDDETNETVQRFYREARSAATLRHANICPVYDVGEIEGRHYIAMAFIDGRPLTAFVSQVKPPSTRSAAMVVRKLALALQEAHDQGIVHRDLKPANIMVDSKNEPIIMDFGLARRAEQSDDTRLTQAGTIIGTPAYMSPEQLDGHPDKIGPSSDVYALGVLLYELLTGTLPFEGTGTVISVIKEILTKAPPNPAEMRPEVDAELSRICRKAMAKEEAERYSSMRELASDLTRYLKSGSAGSSGTKLATAIDPEIVRMEEQCQLVRTLCSEGQFEAAESILQKMVDSTEPKTGKYSSWAKKQLPGVQTQMLQKTQVAESPGDLGLPVDLMQQLPATSTDTNSLATETLSYSSSPNYQHAPASQPSFGKLPTWMIAAIGGPIILCILLMGVIIGGWFNGPPGPPPPHPEGGGAHTGNGEHDRDEDDDDDDDDHDEDEDDRDRKQKKKNSNKRGNRANTNDARQRAMKRIESLADSDGVIVLPSAHGPHRRFWFVKDHFDNDEMSVTIEQVLMFYSIDESDPDVDTFAERMLGEFDNDTSGFLTFPDEVEDRFWFDNPEGRDNSLTKEELNTIAERLAAPPHDFDLRGPGLGPPPEGDFGPPEGEHGPPPR